MRGPDCLDDEALFALVDEPEKASAHLEACVPCAERKRELETLFADLREPIQSYPVDRFVDELTARLTASTGRAREEARGPRGRVFRFAGAGLAVVSLAAAVMLAPRMFARDVSDGFAARGAAAEAGLARNIELGLDLVVRRERSPVEVTPTKADVVAPRDGHLLLSYGTRGASSSAFLLCFAVDRGGEIHWLYPAYENASADPPSVELVAGRELGPMPTEAALEGIAVGRVRVVAILTESALHVSDVERLPPAALEESALRGRFHDADVRSWSLSVGSP